MKFDPTAIKPVSRRREVQALALDPQQIHPASPLMRWRVKPSGRPDGREEWIAGTAADETGCILFWPHRQGEWAGSGYRYLTPRELATHQKKGTTPPMDPDTAFLVEETPCFLKAQVAPQGCPSCFFYLQQLLGDRPQSLRDPGQLPRASPDGLPADTGADRVPQQQPQQLPAVHARVFLHRPHEFHVGLYPPDRLVRNRPAARAHHRLHGFAGVGEDGGQHRQQAAPGQRLFYHLVGHVGKICLRGGPRSSFF